MHPKNRHINGYDFDQLCKSLPALKAQVKLNPAKRQTIDFSNPEAVKLLNQALILHHYQMDFWEIPDEFLLPSVPGRSDYIHHLSDMLTEALEQRQLGKTKIHILDIGVGANCIYPILGRALYQWEFTGVDTDEEALKSAQHIVDKNNLLKGQVHLKLQTDSEMIFENIIQKDDRFDACICNPPFYKSLDEANKATERKWRNLKLDKKKKTARNFQGRVAELCYPGGEKAFIEKIIVQSEKFASQFLMFSTLVSKKEALPKIFRLLEKHQAKRISSTAVRQGQKGSHIVSWTFLTNSDQLGWKRSKGLR